MRMMTKAGYRKAFSAGLSAASPIIGPIIPPSVAMVILGATAEISIGRLFLGGLFPGLLLALALMVNVALRAHLTVEGRTWPVEKVPLKKALKAYSRALLHMCCPIIIVGGIVLGVVTPTEAAILAIDFALFLGLVYREMSWKKLWETLEDTIASIGVFMYLIAIASFFTWVVLREGLPTVLKGALAPLISYNPTVALFVMLAFLLFLGCFLDTTPAILLLAPILIPIVRSLGIDVVHFGVFMTLALCIGIVTPPFGICVFVLSDVAQLPVKDVQKEAIRYVPAMIIVAVLLILFPQIVVWLPNMVFK
jgi:tripartite ATP-independent transporter DctM subunit